MPKEHLKFHSEKGKRLLLIADDETINREILGNILKDQYDLLFAEDGIQALEQVRAHSETLSLALLDLKMPGLSGQEVISQIREDEKTSNIPIIVLTADQNAEVESLSLGASDFIPKPYPSADVIEARITKSIELAEDKQVISDTERDHLTGLYNRDYFYTYAHQLDLFHKDRPMDAIIIDISHFRMINERYGKGYGDELLKRVAARLKEMVADNEGIVCRRVADTYMVYCPHIEDPADFLAKASKGVIEGDSENRVRLRMGIYANVDKTENIERRFDRAKSAADSVRNNFNNSIGVYDKTMLERELYAEHLIEDFYKAIEEKQFTVFYQPKFDITTDIPVLASAEALVRWQHPEMGMISPGVFIPLFEENGLIQKLDKYVWQTAAAQIRTWKEKYDITIPVSVNVSRVDMYDNQIIEDLTGIVESNGLENSQLLLEITESAYTQDSDQIISTVNMLRDIGFGIEMDDFGTGYSSLNMISTLPIDALKLDMQFIRNAFNDRKDTHMLKVIIEIAEHLSVPVIAEGVETEEQFKALKAMGCDMVQGYYFSKPVPPEEYELFVAERAKLNAIPIVPLTTKTSDKKTSVQPTGNLNRIAYALSSGFERVFYVDTNTDHYVEFSSEGKCEDLQIEKSGDKFFADLIVNIRETIYPQDQERVILNMEKETLLSQLIGNQPFSMTFRLGASENAEYYNVKVVRANTDDHHIVLGISNVDKQIRDVGGQALQAAREMAFRDALTGVKSKHAFTEAEGQWNERMSKEPDTEFAVVVCDINDLKNVNDSLGHKAGDQYIKDAAMIICNVFKHSPVFRIGGDEFVAILNGTDYEKREALLKGLQSDDEQRNGNTGVIFASGMSERVESDRSFSDIFDRADAAMYRDKEELKNVLDR